MKARELAGADPNRIAIQLSDWAAQGDWRLYFLDRDRIEKVTPEQVKAVARNYLRPSNRTVGLYIPTDKAERTPIPATPDLAAMVEGYKGRDTGSAGESFDVTPARIEAQGPAARADRRDQGRPPAQEDAKRDGPPRPQPPRTATPRTSRD